MPYVVVAVGMLFIVLFSCLELLGASTLLLLSLINACFDNAF